MEAIHIDAKTGQQIPAFAVSGESVGFISWRRLAEVLGSARELRGGENVVSYQIDDRGLTFRVSTR